MFFHSIASLFLFLPLAITLFPLVSHLSSKAAKYFLLLFSLFFYGFDNPWFLLPLSVSALIDYFISRRLISIDKDPKWLRKALVSLSILTNIGLLASLKYTGLFLEIVYLFDIPHYSSNDFLRNLILPAGISFYTFQTLSFTIDSYRKKVRVMPVFFDYILYVCYFPQLVAGPILRPSDFFDLDGSCKLHTKNSNKKSGFQRICFGLFLKLCFADELGRLNDIAFSSDVLTFNFLDAWTMAFGFGLQIYFDFSAYSHMAIGISQCIGLPIRENFKFPYLSTSATEFWRRWHISLSSWVSDYLYAFIKKRTSAKFLGIMSVIPTWMLMGIWHGASLRFAVWGLLNGLLILFHRMFKALAVKSGLTFTRSIHLMGWLLTLFSIMSTWLIFRSESWSQAYYLYLSLLKPSLTLSFRENYYLFVFIFLSLCLLSGLAWSRSSIRKFTDSPLFYLLSTIFTFSAAMIFVNRQVSFIYFQF